LTKSVISFWGFAPRLSPGASFLDATGGMASDPYSCPPALNYLPPPMCRIPSLSQCKSVLLWLHLLQLPL